MTTDPRVDAYLARLPAEQRDLLQALRDRIKVLAPEADETISYAMPAFRLRDRFLLSYAGWKRHSSIYAIHDELLAKYAPQLRGYATTKGSLHFSTAQPLPDELLVEFVRDRVATIENGGR
ncbi:MAG: DUF1801 domain-containing protein [Chloroflexota bacterium]